MSIRELGSPLGNPLIASRETQVVDESEYDAVFYNMIVISSDNLLYGSGDINENVSYSLSSTTAVDFNGGSSSWVSFPFSASAATLITIPETKFIIQLGNVTRLFVTTTSPTANITSAAINLNYVRNISNFYDTSKTGKVCYYKWMTKDIIHIVVKYKNSVHYFYSIKIFEDDIEILSSTQLAAVSLLYYVLFPLPGKKNTFVSVEGNNDSVSLVFNQFDVDGSRTTVTTSVGDITSQGIGNWYNNGVSINGQRYIYNLDTNTVSTVSDSSYPTQQLATPNATNYFFASPKGYIIQGSDSAGSGILIRNKNNQNPVRIAYVLTNIEADVTNSDTVTLSNGIKSIRLRTGNSGAAVPARKIEIVELI